jgi:hypothetical protein
VQAIVTGDPDEVEQVWRDHVYRSGLETVDYLRSVAMSSGVAPRRLPVTPLKSAR